MAHTDELNPTARVLLGPGPSEIHPRVYKAMITPTIGHMDPQFHTIMDEVQGMLRTVFRTENEFTIVLPATGGAGMEACLVNLLEPGDEAVVCVNGVFGERMAEIARRCGAGVTRVEAPWGRPVEASKVKEALAGRRVKLVSLVHGETSTGVLQPIQTIARLARDAGALTVVDAVTTLGGVDVRIDEWGVDAAYSGSQKCLSAPSGLAPVTLSPRAVEAIRARKTPVASWYFDLLLHAKYWGPERTYHHTAPICQMYGFREALRLVLEEGLDARVARHRRNHLYLKESLEDMGFGFIAQAGFQLPVLNVVRLPAGCGGEEAACRRRLLEEFQIEIAGGLGTFAGKVWRIGLMGNGSNENHISLLLHALRRVMTP